MTHISQWSQWVTQQPEIIDLFKFKAFFLFELKEKESYCKRILKLQCVRLSPPFPQFNDYFIVIKLTIKSL